MIFLNDRSVRMHTLVTRAYMVVLAGALSVTAVSAQSVHTDYDHKTDFAQFHTFSIYRVHATDGIVEKRLHDDIEQSLSQRGYREVQNGGDLSVTAIGGMQNQQEYTSFYDGLGGGFGYGGWGGRRGFGGWGGGGGNGFGETTTTESTIAIGTLVVDVYDSKSHQLVFRGTSSSELSKNADKNAAKGEKAVDKIFDKLPKNSIS